MSTAVPSPDAQPAGSHEFGALRALVIAHGAFNVLLGVALIAIPGRTLTLIAVLAGISLCLIGIVDIARALLRGLTGSQRALRFAVGGLALVAGIVVMARPDGSLKVIVLVAGLYLIISGLTRIVVREDDGSGGASLLGSVISVAAGAVLLVWPDVTVGAMATIYGLFLLALGDAEVVFGIARR